MKIVVGCYGGVDGWLCVVGVGGIEVGCCGV